MRNAELLSRLIAAHELAPSDPLLCDEYFAYYASEWDFVKTYYQQFGCMPTKGTFLAQFPDFEFEESEASAQWLADEVAQDVLDGKLRTNLEELDSLRQLNPRDALTRMQTVVTDLRPFAAVGGIRSSGDLWNGKNIAQMAEGRRSNEEAKGIKPGFELLDAVTKGTQRGEIETIFARPGVGKSFVLLHGAIAASRAGRRVAFFSPEMDKFETGVRFQSYTMHVSAAELMSGEMADEDWTRYLRDLVNSDRYNSNCAPVMFYEPSVMGHQISTADIASVIRTERPDLVCVDGLMLVAPTKTDRDIRKQILNTIAELKEIAVETGVPIRLAHQANRQSEIPGRRTRPTTIDELIPALHHMAESGSVEQYSNRAIALARTGGRLYLAIRKNRNGPSGRIISVEHDIDRGRFRNEKVVPGSSDLNSLESLTDCSLGVMRNPADLF